MSDERVMTAEYTIADEAWWWMAVQVFTLLSIPEQQIVTPEDATGIRIIANNVPHRSIEITVKDGATHIRTTTTADYPDFWKDTIDKLLSLAHRAVRIRRAAIGTTSEGILDRYYEAKDRGDSPNLRETAERAGVNESSLREAKIRYDKRRRERKHKPDD
jgi:hypothetical protein